MILQIFGGSAGIVELRRTLRSDIECDNAECDNAECSYAECDRIGCGFGALCEKNGERRKSEMSPTRNPSEFTVQQLKEKLKTFGLSTAGSKSDLINRLKAVDPAGSWLREPDDVRSGPSDDEEQDLNASGMTAIDVRGTGVSRREMEVIRREKELLERELAMAQRELEFLRERERSGMIERRLETEAETSCAEAW